MTCGECGADLAAGARFCHACGAPAAAPPPAAPDDPLRKTLEQAIGFQYRIIRLLGRGGMGAVYLAHEFALDRDVAIKVLPPEHASTPELRERFKREARTAARLSHPHIVPLYTFGEVAALMYFVMGYVDGESLADRLARDGPLDGDAASVLLGAVCDALAYAHGRGIVHRDIKPDNILIDGVSGAPLLTDFGIAKPALGDAQLTTAGQLIGTPHYMSPEQAMGRTDVGPASDLYSLGIVGYEAVSGRRPFEAQTSLDALTQRLTQAPRPLEPIAGRLSPEFTRAIDRCLKKEPAERWPDAATLKAALVPTEEDVEDAPAMKILRSLATVFIPLALLAAVYLAFAHALEPDAPAVARLGGILGGIMSALLLMAVIVTIRLHLAGRRSKEVFVEALRQPRWWRSWYPRRLRRPGDVWDRLPWEFRVARAYRGAFRSFLFAVFVPFYLITAWDRRLPDARIALIVLLFAGIGVMLMLSRRAIKAITSRSPATGAEAQTILSTPSWRASAWRKPAAAALLSGRPPAMTPASTPQPSAAETRLSSAEGARGNDATRLS